MRVYLDYHSTTPVDGRVVEAMEPYFSDCFGNPSALHVVGEEALGAVNLAKKQVADVIGATAENIHFCSGATEANNIVLKGSWLNRRRTIRMYDPVRIITSPVEHGSIIRCVEYIQKFDPNVEICWLKVNKDGNIDIEHLENLLKEKQSFVSVMMANNEIGTIYDVKEIGRLCKKYGSFFHTDATQALGKININVEECQISAMSLSAHKIYGPKGVGALYVAKDETIEYIDPLLDGGYQNTYTSGTHNVPGIVGMGTACNILSDKDELDRIGYLRDKLLDGIVSNIDGVIINGTMNNRLSNNLNISIKKVPSEALIMGMTDVIVSGGAACKSGNHKASHVLEAIGAEEPNCAIRFGLGRWTTEEEIEYAIGRIIDVVNSVRS